MRGALPTLNPMAASFTPHGQTAAIAGSARSPACDTPRPALPRPWTPLSLEDLARELRELQWSGKSNGQRRAVMHDQRRQLLRHMTDAKGEIDQLEDRLRCKESVEGSQDILKRLKELDGLCEWVGYKWIGVGEEMADLEAEIEVPGG